ncbi:dimethylarginine dimethylaminohydrolase family protein [Phenylobacterium sp.]|jgi:N-dimethylarginine dimethylaminohydrolase|uniref:dimethylarginine dimethylaminohydrolase family protein n=1 Tax=Phenylobacterium sp. TaxID=1871053 RepID=UPI002F95DE99
MSARPFFLMTDPDHFEVCYQINPWMQPRAWKQDPKACLAEARSASADLKQALKDCGAQVETIGAVRDLPDLVFPANAAIVLDGRVLLARFRCPERQGEEAIFRSVFSRLKKRGIVQDIIDLPEGLFQEGAGDCIWDLGRQLFWAGYGPRSSRGALAIIQGVFGQEVVPLQLATDRYYHLDTCFCPLSGGEVLYYPPAFTEAGLAAIHARVAPHHRVEATDEEAQAFCVNAVNLGHKVVMARAPASLKAKLRAHGYDLVEIDLSPFMLSGGAAYCMTLRLDRTSVPSAATLAAE